jgi:hypothetical protein
MQRHQKYLAQRMTRLRREALRLVAGRFELDRRFRLMLTECERIWAGFGTRPVFWVHPRARKTINITKKIVTAKR